MREKMVAQMNAELEQTIRSDKTVMIVSIILNIIMLCANTSVAAAATGTKGSLTLKLVLLILIAFVVIINLAIWFALASSKKRRKTISAHIGKFWEEEGLGKYQDDTISSGYATRSSLFTIVVMAVGGLAFFIPIIIFLTNSGR
jgi:hypothetical protein